MRVAGSGSASYEQKHTIRRVSRTPGKNKCNRTLSAKQIPDQIVLLAGTRTRVAWVKATYPDRLDYEESGSISYSLSGAEGRAHSHI